MSKCVILLGGHSTGTAFRPLSIEIPKPLFPLAGVPQLAHHLEACRKIPNLKEILLVGFFPPAVLHEFLAKMQQNFAVPIRYLNEGQALGTAGGLYKFRKEILDGNPTQVVVIHHDILCNFPLSELSTFHASHGKGVSILGKKIPQAEASHFGCLVEDPRSHQVLHFAEKPETFVSDLANCGVYVFSPSVFNVLEEIALKLTSKEVDILGQSPRTASGEVIISLERDLFADLVVRNEMFLFQTHDFFLQVKVAGEITRCQEIMLREYRKSNPAFLAKPGDGKTSPLIVGDVFIDGTASVHPTAKIGPNVAIGPGVKIAAGARVKHAIILDRSEIKEHACVMYSVIGGRSCVGPWARIEGTPNPHAATKGTCGITIFGSDVSTVPEVIVRNSVVLQHKAIGESCQNSILL